MKISLIMKAKLRRLKFTLSSWHKKKLGAKVFLVSTKFIYSNGSVPIQFLNIFLKEGKGLLFRASDNLERMFFWFCCGIYANAGNKLWIMRDFMGDLNGFCLRMRRFGMAMRSGMFELDFQFFKVSGDDDKLFAPFHL